ncbi:MAG TPA: hypothetical protein DSN98_01585 [Thermoplasmata archaeon]|jgi:phenylacetate-CoA ligase|nr:MAG TPA: hypothetical protein DSN98_01585 [Thermoplasmata archaeon]
MSTFTLVRSYLAMRRNEKKSRENILRLQQKKFRALLQHAFQHSRFYHDLYTSAGITSESIKTVDIEDLPIVDKDILMEHFDEVMTQRDVTKKGVQKFIQENRDPNDLYLGKYHVLHTSGSSGKIGMFVYAGNDWDRFFPYIIRVSDLGFHKSKSVFYGATTGHFTGVSFTAWCRRGVIGFFCDPLILDITKPLQDHVKRLNIFQPDILGGYFTGLTILAKQQKQGNLQIHPRIVVNCGEGIIPKDQEGIEEAFHAPMTNNYGLAECPVLGTGKREYDGMYLMDDLCLIEFKDEYALITNLFNYTQPLIRYKINDMFNLKKDQRKILPFTFVDNIIGRSESMIWLQNREGVMDFIHPIVIAEFYVSGLEKLQFAIKDKTSFEFRAVINGDHVLVEQRIRQELDRILAEKKFTNVTYSVKVVNDLPLDEKTGKFKLIVNSA